MGLSKPATLAMMSLGALLSGCSAIWGFDDLTAAAPADASPADASGKDALAASRFTVVQGLPVGEKLFGIWGADESTIFAVGSNGLHLDYYKGSWHRTQVRLGSDFLGVWGVSATEVYAVAATGDNHGVIQLFDGQAWTDDFVAPDWLLGVWGTDGLVFAVGAKGKIYGKKEGVWTLVGTLPANPKVPRIPQSPVLWSISGRSSTDFAIAADTDRIFHYVGDGAFVNLDPVPDRTIAFRVAWALPAPQAGVFFGSNYLGVEFLTGPPYADAGESFLTISSDHSSSGRESDFIQGIWGTAAQVLFVGSGGHIFQYDVVGDQFAAMASPTDSDLFAAWGSSTSDVWIVGDRELILHGSISP